jgi:signal transduction histidine kinase/FixJ family two-component response regulator
MTRIEDRREEAIVKRVLIVDDEESIRLTLSTVLQRDGYEVQTAGSFEELGGVLPTFPPDTIILDVLLPGLSGLDILKFLKEQGIDAPVIVITGAPDIQSARESLLRGAFDYIAKPFGLDVFRQSVKRALEQKELLDARRELEEERQRYQEELERQVRQRTAELERRTVELATLNEMGTVLSSSLGVDTTLQALYHQAQRLVKFSTFAVALSTEDAKALEFAFVVDDGQQVPSFTHHVEAEKGLSGWVVRNRTSLLVRDLQDAENPPPVEPAEMETSVRSWLGVPLLGKDRLLGLISIQSGQPRAFSSDHQRLLETFAFQAAITLENARLFEEAVARRQHTEAIIRNMADGVLVLDKQDTIVACNPALQNMLDIAGLEVERRSIGDFADSATPGLAALWEIGGSTADSMERSQGEAPMPDTAVSASATREISFDAPLNRIVAVTTSHVYSIAGASLGYVKVVRDITRERELERMKSDFISTVSHELRTPLFYIKGFVELISQGKADDESVMDEFLSIIRDQTKHLDRLVEDLLDTSRAERGTFTVKKEKVPIADLIRQSVADAEGIASQAQVSLKAEVEGALPEVDGDFLRLKQVMMNLIGNAIKFSAAGNTVIVRALLKPDEVWVQVEDEGPGIAQKDLPRIFDKFFQVDSSTTRSFGGVGLGLYISRQIVERLGGRIWAESDVGQGSRFTFALPLHESKSGSSHG